MNFHILTLFPEMVLTGLNTSIIGRALQNGLISLNAVDIRDYTLDKHGKVDDYPYGGGAGMLIQAQPVFDAYQAVTGKLERQSRVRTVYVTPQGTPFTQKLAEDLAKEEDLVFICGHYEGMDERVLEETVTDYVSIGDYVLTGGELPAMVMIDAISRLVPGVLNNDFSARTETFHNDLLEYPQYTRPEVWHGKQVPQVLLSGNHRNIVKWRLERSEERTGRIRPDLYEKYQEKQRLIRQLSARKRSNIHMMETLGRGNGEILFWKDEDILIYDRSSGACLISAGSPEGGERMMEHVPENCSLFVTSREYLNSIIEKRFGVQVRSCCYQACYTRREALAVKHKDIRLLGEEHLNYICEHYPYGGREYIRGRIQAKVMYGAFLDEKIAGFAGMHDDGSMGLLYVEEDFRGMGLGQSLEAFQINRLKDLGFTPYAHIFSDNEVSIRLQEKLGLYLSEDTVWWLEK